MVNKNVLSLVLIFVFILISFEGVCAAEPDEEKSGLIDFSTLFSNLIQGKIFGSEEGIKYNLINGSTNRFTFTGEDASLKIDGISFENIVPKDESGSSSYIEVNELGEVTKVNFLVNNEGGEYFINNIKFNAPPNSRVSYDFEKGFSFPNGADISEIKDFSGIARPITFEGSNLNFMDELNINGKLQLNKYGYLVEEGEASYEGLRIKSWVGELDQVLIVKSNDEEFSYGKNIRTSWIKKGENSIEIQSSGEGRVIMDFLEDNKVLDIDPNDRLEISVFNGDNLKIEKVAENSKVFSKISHRTSEASGGSVRIANDGLLVDIENGDKLLSENLLSLDDILNNKYKAVPVVISSDSFEEELKIDSDGKLKGVLYEGTGSLKEEKVVYELKNPIIDLEDAQLEGLVKNIKDNIQNDVSMYESFSFSQDILSYAKKNGFTNEQSLELINGVIKNTRDNSNSFLSSALSGMKALDSSNLKINPERFNEFTLDVLGVAGTESSGAQKLLDSYSILESGLKEGKEYNLVKDFSTKFAGLDKKYDVNFFKAGVKEYDGNNFNEIHSGISLLNHYGVLGDTSEFLDIKYSNIKDKNSLANEYASAINKYFEDTGSISQQYSILASESIDNIHDFEWSLYNSDSIRDELINKLSLESKYYLISNSIGTSDLYPSTFDKMYEEFNKDRLVEEIKKIDNSGKYWSDFTVQLSGRGKLPEVFMKDPDFFRSMVYDSLILNGDNSNYDSFYKNSVSMQDIIYDIYTHPEKYPGEKEKLESFFIEKYSESKDVKEKAVYSYLLKLNENPVNKNTLDIMKNIPDIKKSKLDEDILNRKEIAGKLYFYNDETSYYDSKNDFIKNYDMKVEWSDDSVTRLSKVIEGKKVIIDMELNSAGIEYVPSAREDLMNQFYIYLAHRGHCYHAPQTFSVESDSVKIIQDGGCQSYSSLGYWQEKFPNSFVISDKNTGRYIDNDKMVYSVLNEIASGKVYLNDMSLDFSQDAGLVVPYRESLNSYMRLFYNEE